MKQDFIGKHVIVRADKAGVFAGVLAEKDGDEVMLKDARRLWYWNGAASLSQLAVEGVKYPTHCKFTVRVPDIIIAGVIEIIPTTTAAERNIAEVPEWKQ